MYNLEDCLKYLLKRWKFIAASAIIFAVILGGVAYLTGQKGLERAETSQVNQEQEEIKSIIKQLEDKIETWNQMAQDNLFMRIDAYNAEVYTLDFTVRSSEKQNNELRKDVANLCTNYINSGEVYSNWDISEDEVAENTQLIKANATEGVVEITGYLIDGHAIEEKVNKIFETISELKELKTGDEFILEKAGSGTGQMYDPVMAEKQGNFLLHGQRYQDSLKVQKEKLESLKEENGPELTSQYVVKRTIKLGMAGFAAGIVFAIILLLLKQIFNDQIQDARELEEKYNIFNIGDSPTGDVGIILEKIRLLLEKKSIEGPVLLVGTVDEGELKKLTENLNAVSNNENLIINGGNLSKNAANMKKMKLASAVVMVEKIGESKIGEVDSLFKVLNMAEKEILGFVVI